MQSSLVDLKINTRVSKVNRGKICIQNLKLAWPNEGCCCVQVAGCLVRDLFSFLYFLKVILLSYAFLIK